MKSPVQNYQGPLVMYDLLYDYYLSNGLYSDITKQLKDQSKWGESMRPLRNPANRVVEFYVSKLWPGNLDGALPIVADNKNIIPAIEQIWKWSNWAAAKQRFSRWFSLFGDGFIKITLNDERDRVNFQVLDPRWITDFKVDKRGYLESLRLDMQYETLDKDGKPVVLWWTENWTKDKKQIWEGHEKGRTDFKSLGNPTTNEPNELDFIPIVHAPFRDIGETRGTGCFVHALDKIDELNRMTSRLHQILFRYNKPIWSVTTDSDPKDKRPKPPRLTENGILDVEDETLLGLPPGSKLNLLVPDINYAAALEIINAMVQEVEYDLPELKYYGMNKQGQVSGIALRYMLGDAIDRVIEARGNAFAALARANEIALTMAQREGLEGFLEGDIGIYEDGSFEHTFADTPVIPLSETEKAEALKALIDSGIDPLLAMKRTGWTDEEIAMQKKYMDEKKAAAAVITNTQPSTSPDEQINANGQPSPQPTDTNQVE